MIDVVGVTDIDTDGIQQSRKIPRRLERVYDSRYARYLLTERVVLSELYFIDKILAPWRRKVTRVLHRERNNCLSCGFEKTPSLQKDLLGSSSVVVEVVYG